MIQQFQDYLINLKGYSKKTAEAYGKDLRIFATWARTNKQDARWSNITREDIDNFIREQVAAGKTPATTNRYLASISGLFRFFQREGLTDYNPARYESRRKRGTHTPNTIPTEQLRTAYEHADGLAKIAISIIATTGIRAQELLNLQWEDIDETTGATKIHGKGSKERMVYLSSAQIELLKQYAGNERHLGTIISSTQRNLRYELFTALRPFCNAPQLSPHAIRHTMATEAAAHGANVTMIARTLGHDSIKTTQIYIDNTLAPVKAVCSINNMFN